MTPPLPLEPPPADRRVRLGEETLLETFRFPSVRAVRRAELLAEGYREAGTDGRPLRRGEFRQIERHDAWLIRLRPLGGPDEDAVAPEVLALLAPTENDRPRCPAGCRGVAKKWGKPRGAAQRWRCRKCLLTWTVSPRGMSGNHLPPEKEERLRVALLAGHSIREAARLAGVAKQTAQERVRDRDDVRCPCGATAGHRGWCGWRYARSAARQAWMARWKERRRLRATDTSADGASTDGASAATLERLRRELVAARPGYLDPETLDLLSPCVVASVSARRLGGGFLLRERNPEKTRLRQRVVDEMAALPGRIHVLSMPALQWIMERDLLAAREAPSVLEECRVPAFTRLHAIEWSRTVFLSALEHIPGARAGFSYRGLNAWNVSTPLISQYSRVRFEDFQPPVDGFRAAWIDFTGPLTLARIAGLSALWRYQRMALLVVTYMRARHQIERPFEKMIWAIADGVVEQFPYGGKTPMMQVHLRRELGE